MLLLVLLTLRTLGLPSATGTTSATAESPCGASAKRTTPIRCAAATSRRSAWSTVLALALTRTATAAATAAGLRLACEC